MKRFATASAVLALCLCGAANGEVFKCVTRDGKVSFASTPCPTYIGETIVVLHPAAQRLSSEWEEADFSHRVNKNATEILQVSRRRKIIITNEKEISDRMQSIRPPPPGVSSTCIAPTYNSACFDPSGGGIRQPMKGSLVRSGSN